MHGGLWLTLDFPLCTRSGTPILAWCPLLWDHPHWATIPIAPCTVFLASLGSLPVGRWLWWPLPKSEKMLVSYLTLRSNYKCSFLFFAYPPCLCPRGVDPTPEPLLFSGLKFSAVFFRPEGYPPLFCLEVGSVGWWGLHLCASDRSCRGNNNGLVCNTSCTLPP